MPADQKTITEDWRPFIDRGEFPQAIDLLQKRLATQPQDPDALQDLGVAHARQNNLADAVARFQDSLRIDPSRYTCLRNLAKALGDWGKPKEAQLYLEKAIRLKPKSADAYYALANLQHRSGKKKTALETMQKAVELDPKSSVFHRDLGRLYNDARRFEDARKAFERALELDPKAADICNDLGVACQEVGALDDAVSYFRRAIDVRPDVAAPHNNLGVALAEMRKQEEAVVHYKKALEIDDKYVVAWNNVGNALRILGRNQEAIEALQRALDLKPDYCEAANNIAIAYLQSGDVAQAVKHYNLAIMQRPDYAEARMNRALAWLASGKLQDGWTEYEWRWSLKSLQKRKLAGKRWDGSPLEGKRLLIRYEQGIGDTIQFIRYAPLLKQRGATVILEGQPPLQQLLSRTPGIDQFIPRGEKIPEYDFATTLLSLPGLFDTRLQTIPASIPYINANEKLVEQWRPRLAALGGFKVGIAWQGNPQHRGDRQRSVPVDRFADLGRIDGVKLVSLQHGFGSEQIAKRKEQFPLETFANIAPDTDGFDRTAAIISNLDLLITVDTSVAHLGGAMGIPVWVALPIAADWRWLREREDSPWYPTLRLFRQQKPGDWDAVFARIRQSLEQKVSEWKLATMTTAKPADRQRATQLIHQGNELVRKNQIAQSQEIFTEAISADPLNPDAHHDLGVALAKLGKRVEAIASFRRSLELKPNNIMAYANLGLAFLHNDQIEESIAHFRKAISLGGAWADVHNNLGAALMRVPEAAGAVEAYKRALYLKPEYAAAHFNLARALLRLGQFDQGWLEFEWRRTCLGYKNRRFAKPRWSGVPLTSGTLLLHAEQGLEDVIQFARYIPHLKRHHNIRIVLECPEPLALLMQRCEGVDQVVPAGKELPTHDLQIPLLSLPALLGTTLQTIPAPVPYLSAEPAKAQHWKKRLSGFDGLKVGVVSKSDLPHKSPDEISVPLQYITALAQNPGIRLIGLKGNLNAPDVQEPKDRFGIEMLERDPQDVDGFMDAAAMIGNLDFLITVDATAAHLAGAMGIPVWLLLPVASEWRWLQDRDDSPWYPNMRLFRQTSRDDWQSVFDKVHLELSKMTPISDAAKTQIPEVTTPIAAQSFVTTRVPPKGQLQGTFDVAVIITTVLRPTLRRTVQSIFDQQFSGRIQILLGIDKCLGDPAILDDLRRDCPAHCALSVLDLGYSTSTRHGGFYNAMPGGALRTMLSYAANAARLTYLDDDNWVADNHLQSLSNNMHGNDWAYSLRWYVDEQTGNPLCVDQWESVGPSQGVYAKRLGGYVDPNCLMIDKIACEPLLRWWCFPLDGDQRGISEDRQVFRHLKEHSNVGKTGSATVFYTIRPQDDLHARRLKWIEAATAARSTIAEPA